MSQEEHRYPYTYEYKDGHTTTVGKEEMDDAQSRHDDLRIIDRYIEYNQKDHKKVEYMTYILDKREDNGEWERYIKVVKLCKTYNVPKELREKKALMVSQDELLSSVWKNDINFLCIYVNIPEEKGVADKDRSEVHGFYYLYGVQCVMRIYDHYYGSGTVPIYYDENTPEAEKVAQTLKVLKDQADAKYGGLINLLRGNFRQAQFLPLQMKEALAIQNTIENAPQLQVIRGIPKTHISAASGVTTSLEGITTTPEGIEQNEEFIRGMLHDKYANVIMAVPIPHSEIIQWSDNTARELSRYKSQYSGMISHNAGVSIPVVFAGNLSATLGNTHGVTDTTGETNGVTNGMSSSTSHGVGTSDGTSHTVGYSNGQSIGVADSTSQAVTDSTSQGLSKSQTLSNSVGVTQSESIGQTHGVTNTESFGRSHTVGQSETFGESETKSITKSHSLGNSVTLGHTSGETLGQTEGITRGHTLGNTHGTSLTSGQTMGSTLGRTMGTTMGDTYGETVGHTTGNTIGHTVGNTEGHTFGNTIGHTVGNTEGHTLGSTMGHTVGNTTGHTVGNTEGHTIGNTMGHTIGNTTGQTIGNTTGHTTGTTMGHTVGDTFGNTVGNTTGHTVGNTSGHTVGDTMGHTVGNTEGHTTGTTRGQTTGSTFGTTAGDTYGLTNGVTRGHTIGNTTGTTVSDGTSFGTSNSFGGSQTVSNGTSNSVGVSQNTGLSQTAGHTIGSTASVGNSASSSVNNGWSTAVNDGFSRTGSASGGHSVNSGDSGTFGNSYTGGATAGLKGGFISGSGTWSNGETGSLGGTIGTGYTTSHSAAGGITGGVSNGVTGGYSTGYGNSTSLSSSDANSFSKGLSQSVGQSQSSGHTLTNAEGSSWSNGTSSSSTHSVGHTNSQSISDSLSNSQSNSHSQALSHSKSDSNSYSLSRSDSNSLSQSVSDSVSRSNSDSFSHSISDSSSNSISNSRSHSSSDSLSHSASDSLSRSTSNSLSQSASDSLSRSLSDSLSHSTSDSSSRSVSDSLSHSASNSLSHSTSDSLSRSASDSLSRSSSDSLSRSASDSLSNSHSRSLSNSLSNSFSHSLSNSLSRGMTDSFSDSNSLSNSLSNSHSLSRSTSLSRGMTEGWSEGVSHGFGRTHSVGQTVSDGVTQSVSRGVSDSTSHTRSDGITRSQSVGNSIGRTESLSHGTSTGIGKTANQGLSRSLSDSQGITRGTSTSDSLSNGTTTSNSNSLSNSQGLSTSRSNALGSGQGMNVGLGPSLTVGRSYQVYDEVKGNLIKLLEVSNTRWNLAVRMGAFHVDAYVVSYTAKAAQGIALTSVTSWGGDNEIATIQCITPSELTQSHLLKHVSVFDPCSMKDPTPEIADNYIWSTIMLSSELAALTHLPRVETGGISTVATNIPPFSVFANKTGEIYFGEQINYEDGEPSYKYYFSKEEFMHTLICGASGSGKTTSAVRMAREVIRNYPDMKIFALDWKNSWRVLKRFAPNGIDDFEFFGMDYSSVRPIRMNLFIPPKHVGYIQWCDKVIESLCLGYGFGNKMFGVLKNASRISMLINGVLVLNENDDPVEHKPMSDAEQDLLNQNIAKVTLKQVYEIVSAMKQGSLKGGSSLSNCIERISDPRVRDYIKSKIEVKSGQGMADTYDSILTKLESYYAGELKALYCVDDYEKCLHIEDIIDGKRIVVLEGGDLDGSSKKAIIGLISWGLFLYSRLKKNRDKVVDKRFYILEEAHRIIDNPDSKSGAPVLDVGENIFEILLNEAREYGVYCMIIVQTPSHLPPALVTNCAILVIHRLGNDEDVTLMTQMLCRNARLDNRDVPLFLTKVPRGWACIRINNRAMHQESEPALVQVARCPNNPPSNEELILTMSNVEIPSYILKDMNEDTYLQMCRPSLDAFIAGEDNPIDRKHNDNYKHYEVDIG